MSMLEYEKEIAIPTKFCGSYSDFAFDGCYYYFIVTGSCKIIKTDSCFCEIEVIKACRCYNSICYDYRENCFYSGACKCNCVYKLNCNLQEIDCISIDDVGIITGLSYDLEKNSVFIAYSDGIIEFKKNRLTTKRACGSFFNSVCSLYPCFIASTVSNRCQNVMIYRDDKCIFQGKFPCADIIKGICYNPCNRSVEFLVNKKGRYSYVVSYKTSLEICWDMDCSHCCECGEHCDIVDSVAKIEMAIAKILDAESEKLKKVIDCSDDIREILSVNNKINETIVNATHLEHVLYNKLKTVK